MELKFILEAILFSAQQPLTPKDLRDILSKTAEQAEEELVRALKKTKEPAVIEALEELQRDWEQLNRSFRLVCVAGAWQFVSKPEFAPWISVLVGRKPRPPRLSQPALETLAIVAYRQPITRAEIEQVRGVAVDGVMQTLLERGLVEQVGRAEVVGRPMTYGTTSVFLEYFGLRNLEDLPNADELRRIEVQKPESLLTVDPGLATAPPDELAAHNGHAPEPEPTPPANQQDQRQDQPEAQPAENPPPQPQPASETPKPETP